MFFDIFYFFSSFSFVFRPETDPKPNNITLSKKFRKSVDFSLPL